MSEIKIACSCDNNYVPHCGALIASVFVNNRNNKIEVNILTDGIDKENREKLNLLAKEFKQEIKIIVVDSSLFSIFSHSKSPIKLPLQTYYRLIIPTLFKDYDKILYLDVDMIVCADLAEIWNLDLGNKAIAGVPDTAWNIAPACRRLGYPLSESYYNAGFGLYNLSVMRETNLWNKAIDMVEKSPEKLLYHDQDLLNNIYHGQFFEVSLKWNFMQTFFMLEPSVVKRQKEELEKYIHNPCIIHYTASLKPWFIECEHPYKSEYWKYLKMTPWAERKPVHIYHDLKTLLKYLHIKLVELKFYMKRDKSRMIRKKL